MPELGLFEVCGNHGLISPRWSANHGLPLTVIPITTKAASQQVALWRSFWDTGHRSAKLLINFLGIFQSYFFEGVNFSTAILNIWRELHGCYDDRRSVKRLRRVRNSSIEARKSSDKFGR
jgi:hypothetical protein